jgi:hypothetical protein
MRPHRKLVIVLDCQFSAWRCKRHEEMLLRISISGRNAPEIHPFTFSDVPYPLVGGENDVVLRPSGGVKS